MIFSIVCKPDEDGKIFSPETNVLETQKTNLGLNSLEIVLNFNSGEREAEKRYSRSLCVAYPAWNEFIFWRSLIMVHGNAFIMWHDDGICDDNPIR
ncbi:hypothetical protein IPJ63_00595 [Candidatus Nomurabacteria bacterium]|nr:MAG: hypothetical protein IPJ63_00595 [Candidatus Nomurabacteria bacterium]